MKSIASALIGVLCIIGLFTCCTRSNDTRPEFELLEESIVQHIGEGAREGAEAGVRILRRLNEADQHELAIGAYRGQKVAFKAASAPPGATHDLIAAGGVYLRVMTPEGKDMRPKSVWWLVIVEGTVVQVLRDNKIVVIEVSESGWHTIDTG